jgi:hypothetical protein
MKFGLCTPKTTPGGTRGAKNKTAVVMMSNTIGRPKIVASQF